MRNLLFIIMFWSCYTTAQITIPGRVINKETREPLAYAKIELGDEETLLTNIDGSFEIDLKQDSEILRISYVGFESLELELHRSTRYLQIGLTPKFEQLQTVIVSAKSNPAEGIIKKAIANRNQNDPEKVLNGFKYSSYSKFIIDNEFSAMQMQADSTSETMETIINEGRAYLSEKLSEHFYTSRKGRKELVTGIETAGFEKPVYNVLAMEVNPLSLYKKEYKLYKTEYAGPLAKNALRNYSYRILDTTQTKRPAYIIYFKPKREKVVAGLEGILYLDTVSFAIQKAKAQLLGAIRLEVDHTYEYFPEKNIWFPSEQTTKIRPGSGGREIAVFGGTISVGTVQQKDGIINRVFGSANISPDLYLSSITRNFNINLDYSEEIENPGAEIEVSAMALDREFGFWDSIRKVISPVGMLRPEKK